MFHYFNIQIILIIIYCKDHRLNYSPTVMVTNGGQTLGQSHCCRCWEVLQREVGTPPGNSVAPEPRILSRTLNIEPSSSRTKDTLQNPEYRTWQLKNPEYRTWQVRRKEYSSRNLKVDILNLLCTSVHSPELVDIINLQNQRGQKKRSV